MDTQRIPVILASRSPRRIELLKTIIENFLVIPSKTDEVCDINLSPEENAIMLGRNKATYVAKNHSNNLIIGADTMVVLKNKIIGKPTDIENARQILRQLSGEEHEVITGITVVHSQILSASQISRVRMKNLNSKDIDSYVESGEPMDKAGAYAIQGEGSFLVESYSGSYTNIIGLPMELLEDLLQKSNFSI